MASALLLEQQRRVSERPVLAFSIPTSLLPERRQSAAAQMKKQRP
ncbi:hypothetical protein P3T23_002376 [Paraburkholderia sp. GAS448]